MNKQNPKKRHHYIPVFYLNGFTGSDGALWVYDKEDKGPFASSPEGIAYERHYFSFTTPTGEKDSETVENWMAALEGESDKVLNKVISQTILTEDERKTFACFVASMMTRTPNNRNNIQQSTADIAKHLNIRVASDKDAFEQMVRNYEKAAGKKIEMSIEELRQFAVNPENYTVSVDSEYAISMALSLIEKLTPVFFKMKWLFLKAPNDCKFLTGDNPLSYTDVTQGRNLAGLNNKNIEVSLPLSRDICALGGWRDKEGYVEVKKRIVKELNRRTVMTSKKFVFAHYESEDIDKFVKKYKGTHPIMIVS
jgi:hypothetical protein